VSPSNHFRLHFQCPRRTIFKADDVAALRVAALRLDESASLDVERAVGVRAGSPQNKRAANVSDIGRARGVQQAASRHIDGS
jgi:hypothetical protein